MEHDKQQAQTTQAQTQTQSVDTHQSHGHILQLTQNNTVLAV